MSPPTALPGAVGAPQTGLSILMNGNALSNPPATTSEAAVPHHARMMMSPEQQRDLADRERQAKSLAAAGMVAETVGQRTHPGMMYGAPTLAPVSNAPDVATSFNGVMDSNSWGMPDVDATLEDMEMDFAKLFDPIHEMESMQTEGSGWPGTDGGGTTS